MNLPKRKKGKVKKRKKMKIMKMKRKSPVTSPAMKKVEVGALVNCRKMG